MEEVVYADKVIVMDQGKVVMQGTPKEIFSRVEELKSYRLDVPQVTMLAHELKTKGIRVLSVNPSWVKTEFFEHAEKSSNDAITYFNVMYEAKDVIQTAIHDLYHTKKDVSVHGFKMKAQAFLVKILPQKIVMNI
jgi:ABC-type multidrug transport system ATPase subunit